MIRRSTGRALLVGSIVLVGAETADAHLVQTGFGSFYDGLAHLLITVEDLLLVLALALLAATQGKPESRSLLVTLPLAWLAGGVLGALLLSLEESLATTISFSLVGILVAANARVPQAGILVLALLGGGLHGAVNGATLAPGGEALALTGVVLAVFALTTLVTALVVSLRAGWTRVAVRVAGSWVVAIGMLMIGWAFRENGG